MNKTLADLRGTRRTPPLRSKFFQFHAVWFGFLAPGRLAPPPRGIHGSATTKLMQLQRVPIMHNIHSAALILMVQFSLVPTIVANGQVNVWKFVSLFRQKTHDPMNIN